MKYCRFQLNNQPHYGLVEAVAGVEQITRVFLNAPQDADEDLKDVPTRRTDALPLAAAALLPPVCPSKIVCVGRNYREHASELGNEVPVEPLIFLKPPSTIIAPGDDIAIPAGGVSKSVEYEGEIAAVVRGRWSKFEENKPLWPY